MRRLMTIGVGLALVLTMGALPASADTALNVIAGCAQGGSAFGLEIVYDGTNTNAFLIDNSPTNETRVITEVFFRLNTGAPFNFTMDPGEKHQVLRWRDPGGDGTLYRVTLRRQTGGAQDYVMSLWVQQDSLPDVFVGEKLLTTDAWQRMIIDWEAATGVGANDGSASINKGAGVPKGIFGAADNPFAVNQEQLGGFAGIDPNTTGSETSQDRGIESDSKGGSRAALFLCLRSSASEFSDTPRSSRIP